MALTLDTGHALYGNLLAFICVDDDNTVKDLVSGYTFTLESGASVGSGTWGNHLSTVKNGFSTQGATADTAIPLNTSTNSNITIFAAFNSITDGDGSSCFVEGGSNHPNFKATGPSVSTMTGNNGSALVTGSTDVEDTNAHTICGTRTGESSHELFIDASSEGTGGGWAFNTSNANIVRMGGASGQGSVTAEFVYYIIFDKVLSGTEITNLHNSLGSDNAFAMLNSAGTSVDATLASIDVTTYAATVSGPLNITATLASIDVTSYQASVSVDASITTEPLKNNTGTLLNNTSGIIAAVYDITDGSLVVRKTGLTSDASGIVTFSDPALSSGTTYHVIITISATSADGLARIQAA